MKIEKKVLDVYASFDTSVKLMSINEFIQELIDFNYDTLCEILESFGIEVPEDLSNNELKELAKENIDLIFKKINNFSCEHKYFLIDILKHDGKSYVDYNAIKKIFKLV